MTFVLKGGQRDGGDPAEREGVAAEAVLAVSAVNKEVTNVVGFEDREPGQDSAARTAGPRAAESGAGRLAHRADGAGRPRASIREGKRAVRLRARLPWR